MTPLLDADPTPDILTTPEVARLLRVHKMTAYSLARCGKIPAVKVGGSWRFSRMELLAWINAQSKKRMQGLR